MFSKLFWASLINKKNQWDFYFLYVDPKNSTGYKITSVSIAKNLERTNPIWKELTSVEGAESFLLLLNLKIDFLTGIENGKMLES